MKAKKPRRPRLTAKGLDPMRDADLMGARRCSARSKQRKAQCKRSAIPGGTVCRYHGGAAPQVMRSARERLAALVDPAIDRLTKLLKTKQQHVALGAVKDVLDRNGFKPTEHVKHSGTLTTLPDDQLDARILALEAQVQS